MQMSQMLLAQASLGDTLTKAADKGYGWIATLVVAVILLVTVIAVLKAGAGRYKKVPPDRALVRYGRGRTSIITGGSTLVLPLLYDTYEMDLSAFQVQIELNDVPNLDRIPVTIHANATCHISNTEALLQVAAGKFGRKAADTRFVAETLKNALEGHLRVIIGQMDMDTILSKRDEFNQKVVTEAETELHKLGCEIAILNIQKVTDAHGYIDALGKPKSAAVKADALSKEAAATRDQEVNISNAQRESATTKAANDQKIAEANQTLQMKQAAIATEVNAANAKAAQAGPKAEAEASQGVFIAQVQAQEAKTREEIKLQDAVAARTEAEMKATVLKKAEAEKQRLAIEAEGKGNARNIEANAGATASIKEAEGKATNIRTVGAAEAEMTATKGQAEADAKKSNLLAEAEGETAKAGARRAQLLAEADGETAKAKAVEALLLAQATGALELNKAYSALSPEARQLFQYKQLLESLPAVINAAGEAGAKIMAPYAQAVTAAFGSIDNLSIYDGGGNGTGAGSPLERVSGIGVSQLGGLIQQLKGSGLFPVINAIAINKFGIDLNAAGGTLLEATVAETTAVTGSPKGDNGGVDKKAPAAAPR